MLELPLLTVSGTARQMGRAQGEALRAQIGAFVDQRLSALRGYLEERKQPALFERFLATGQECLGLAQRFDAEAIEEHDGIAEAAGVDRALLYAATNMTDLRDVLLLPKSPDREGCTSLLVPGARTRSGQLLAAQTWDLNPTDLDFVVAIQRRPLAGPQTWAITCTGALSLIGMNEWGVAVGTTNIKTRASRAGIGYLSVLHRAIRTRSRVEAQKLVQTAPLAAAHTYWLADVQGACELECDPDTRSARELTLEPIVQTNHCQADVLSAREGEPPTSSSRARLARALNELARGNVDLKRVQELFADRSDGVDSINRYVEDDQGTSTNACIVCSPTERKLWACRGSADRGRWEELSFS
ncbi:MAG TPA: C45 family peptidase [Polyangiaceae bacterium]|nr:C45 family peptidase [Polyangiaceae bacterium]